MTSSGNAARDCDERSFREVQAAVSRLDPVPPHVLQVSREAFAWRSVDDDLARLTFDSAEQPRDLIGVRGTASLRVVCFATDELNVDLQVIAEGQRRSILGEIAPEQPADIWISHSGGMVTVRTDERGRFRADGIVAGDVTMRCSLREGDRTVTTYRFPL